ncbi:hypothetical protein Tco_1453330, partial [Tanacetum coccineum]
MGLLDFVKVANPFKGKIRKWTLAENEVPLITETEDRVSLHCSSEAIRQEACHDDVLHNSVRTYPPTGRFVFLSSSSADTDTHAASQVALRNQGDVGFLDAFNINIAQHICMVSELRLCYEHEIMTREKFEKKFTDSAATIQQRDMESDDLRVRLEKSEAEVAKVIELRKCVSDLEATVTVKCDGLKDQVVGESRIREEFVSQQDVAERRFKECVVELDARIADVRHDIDNDLYLHMLTAIAGRRWVVRNGFRLAVHKCARSIECQSALGK